MSSVYRPLLRRAWSITWQEKRLWIFGLFAALIVSGGELNVIVRNLDRLEAVGTWADMARAGNLSSLPLSFAGLAGYSGGFYTIIALLLALVLFVVWFAVVAEGALVWGIERTRRRAAVTLEEGIAQGKRQWGKVVALTVGFHISAHFAWVIFALPPFLLYVGLGSSAWFTVFLIIAFLCLVPVGFIATLLFRLALCAVVIEQESVVKAVMTAWHLFYAHWLVLLETVVLLVVGTTVTAILSLSVAAVGLSLLFGPLMLLSFVVGAPAVLSMVIGFAIVLFLLMLLGIGAVLATLQQAVWVLLFVRLRESPPFAKLVRLIAERGWRFGTARM